MTTSPTRDDLRGRNITVFDAEIKLVPGEQCGWRDFDKMGISVACAFSFKTLEYSVFMDDNLPDLVAMINDSDLAVGFNTVEFDVPLLEATTGLQVDRDHHYDLLFHSRTALGWRPGPGGGKMPSGCKLDNHLAGTFGREFMKTGHGAEAPKWWQQRKLGRLISYCLDDVKREARLFKYAWDHGHVKTDTHGVHTLIQHPRDFMDSLANARAHAEAGGLTEARA